MMLCQAWEPPHPLTINGEFLGYKLTYESRRPRGGTGGGAGGGTGGAVSPAQSGDPRPRCD